ncbi:MerR family transcriptional regulator [Marinomonas transparens]|uniref:MerR family transcriptional regulator n=1 Tax=Marinomonas transparens TaxID=2795388 RepID=A0A934JIU9_9GAMM|nr:MerR family transcriptional regulator [Marinomonas transparens]MBJ7536865.1 MerR family transcriptional regulator [Marinomonas transparens]
MSESDNNVFPAKSPSDLERLSEDQNYFPIRDLSLKTGVNSVTLRAWERRYGLLKPKRTAKGHRLYGEADVQRVEAILRWIQQGVAVSKVRALLDQGVSVEEASSTNEWLALQNTLIEAAKNYREEKIEQLYQQVFSQYPAAIAIRNWLLPSFEKLDESAALACCEMQLIHVLSNRLASVKSQRKKAAKVLVTGLSSQRTLWCYMAAALLSDKGFVCRVVPNVMQAQDWTAVLNGVQAQGVVAFCGNEQAGKATELLQQMQQWHKPVAAIGASFWLAANDADMTSLGKVTVYSDALEAVVGFIEVMESGVIHSQ